MNRTNLLVILSLAATAITGRADAQTREQNWAQCGNSLGGDATITACTAIIKSGVETTESLVTIFTNRGKAHTFKAHGDGDPAHKDNGEYDLAFQDFYEALRKNPNFAEAYAGRGNAHKNKGKNFGNNRDYDLAIQDYDQAIKLVPDDWHHYVGRGMAYSLMGQHARAIQDLDQSIKLKPVYFVLLFRGNVYRDMGQYDLAIQDYNSADKEGAGFASAARCEANALAGRFQAALVDCNKYLGAHPDYAGYNALGFLYLKMREAGKAITAYNSALVNDNDRKASSLYGRGEAELMLNNPTAAKADMDAARRIDLRIDETFVKVFKFPPAP
jgi:tetratricopeptide (TPR) repeat protein